MKKMKFTFLLNFQLVEILGQMPGKWDEQFGIHQVTTEEPLPKELKKQFIGMDLGFHQTMISLKNTQID